METESKHEPRDVIGQALDLALDLSTQEAARVHEAYAGYKPHKHAAVDLDVQLVHAAIAAHRAAQPAADADKRDAERYRWAIDLDDNADTLLWAVRNSKGDKAAIESEIDAARSQGEKHE